MLTGDNGQLFGWSQATWDLLDQAGILLGVALPTLTLLLGVLAWIKRDRLRAWLRRNRFPAVGGLVRKDARWTAILFTVSRKEVPTWVMQRTRPAWVGLIGSQSQAEPVQALEHVAAEAGIRVVGTRLVRDPDDPAEALAAARELLAALGANGVSNVAVDVTGGKVPMSLGAFMAAEEAKVDSIYVSVEYRNGAPQPETASIRRVSGNPTATAATKTGLP
jgi:hypothetical protein